MAEIGTRDRMIVSTALLVRERGARATSIDDVLLHSGAPRGSVYHHFPGGRDEMLREATAYAGEYVARRIAPSDDPLGGLDALIDGYRRDLIASEFRSGCPVVAVAIESRDDDEAIRAAAGAVFGEWRTRLAEVFAAAGVPGARAGELALTAIAAIEGAIVLCRALGDIAPLDAVGADLHALVEAELEGTR